MKARQKFLSANWTHCWTAHHGNYRTIDSKRVIPFWRSETGRIFRLLILIPKQAVASFSGCPTHGQWPLRTPASCSSSTAFLSGSKQSVYLPESSAGQSQPRQAGPAWLQNPHRQKMQSQTPGTNRYIHSCILFSIYTAQTAIQREMDTRLSYLHWPPLPWVSGTAKQKQAGISQEHCIKDRIMM